jgi:hypothetical protein
MELLDRTVEFRRADDLVTSQFVRVDEAGTAPFVREPSEPYAMLEVAAAPVAPASSPMILVIIVLLAAAFVLGVGVPFLVM